MLSDLNREYDSYIIKDKAGKISLLFFAGLYLLFTFDPVNWIGMGISGFFMLSSLVFIFYNDYRHEKYHKMKEKLIGMIVTLLFAAIAGYYAIKTYSIDF